MRDWALCTIGRPYCAPLRQLSTHSSDSNALFTLSSSSPRLGFLLGGVLTLPGRPSKLVGLGGNRSSSNWTPRLCVIAEHNDEHPHARLVTSRAASPKLDQTNTFSTHRVGCCPPPQAQDLPSTPAMVKNMLTPTFDRVLLSPPILQKVKMAKYRCVLCCPSSKELPLSALGHKCSNRKTSTSKRRHHPLTPTLRCLHHPLIMNNCLHCLARRACVELVVEKSAVLVDHFHRHLLVSLHQCHHACGVVLV